MLKSLEFIGGAGDGSNAVRTRDSKTFVPVRSWSRLFGDLLADYSAPVATVKSQGKGKKFGSS